MLSAAKVALAKLFHSRARSEDDSVGMGFFEHIEELRKTLFRCCAAFALSAAVSLCFYKEIFVWLRWPLDKALALDESRRLAHAAKMAAQNPPDALAGLRALWELLATGKLPAEAAPMASTAVDSPHFHMQVLKLIDIFSVLMDVVLFGGIALSGPFILAFGAGFIAPALTPREKRLIAPVLASATALFFAGAALSFFWLTPISINFSLGLARDFGVQFNWTATDYYSFVVMMTMLVGLVFEFPLVIIGLQYLEITSTRWLFSIWRQALVGILVVAVVFTPLGDPISVSVLTGVLFVLYLISVLVGDRLARIKRRRALASLPEPVDASE